MTLSGDVIMGKPRIVLSVPGEVASGILKDKVSCERTGKVSKANNAPL